MSKKTIKQVVVFIVIAVMITTLTACGSSSSNQNSQSGMEKNTSSTAEVSTASTAPKTPAPVELKVFLPGDPANDIQAVVDEFQNRTKDMLNTTLKLTFIPWADLKKIVTMKLVAGEEMDSVFDAPWNGMQDMITKDQYDKLDSYFNNDQYPGLKKAFAEEYIGNNQFMDKNSESHIYGIPFTRYFGNVEGIYLRKDLREKYGLTEIKNLADLEAFFDKVKQNEKGMIPIGINGSIDGLQSVWDRLNPAHDNKNIQWNVALGLHVAVTGDKKVIVSGQDYIDTEFNTIAGNDPMWQYKKSREWYKKGYIEKDVISQKDMNGGAKAGKFASYCGSVDTYMSQASAIESAIPGAKVEFFSLNEQKRNMAQGVIPTDFKAWNFACIPATSKNIDRTMQFFDWIFSSVQNHDLFEYGIDGKHFIAVGDDKYKLPDGIDQSKNYNLVGYQLTWNPTMIRYPEDMPEDKKAYCDYLGNVKSYYQVPLVGFSFNDANVKDEETKINALGRVTAAIDLGLTDDIEGTLKKIDQQLDKAGRQKVREELKKQVEEYLANQK